REEAETGGDESWCSWSGGEGAARGEEIAGSLEVAEAAGASSTGASMSSTAA
ncbi:hypothetical protein U1Q18_036477, partial [Sarracenia purpurea var. burkii]